MTAPRIRAGDPERQQAVERLARHFTEGRLDGSEYDERVRLAYAVVYLDELPALFADLPAEPVRKPRPDEDYRGDDDYRAAWERGYHQSGWGSPVGGPFHAGRPGPLHRGQLPRRRPRIPVSAVLLGVLLLFTVGVATHGFFLFPLIWIALFGLATGRRGRRWGGSIERR